MFEIKSGRIKPKKEPMFGKKPYKGKNKNRTGRTVKTDDVQRIKPVYDSKKGSIKHRVENGTFNLLGKDKPVRFASGQYWQRVLWLQELEACQVCQVSRDLDHPHHPETGSNRDDRHMINICVDCHRKIHGASGYADVNKSLDECIKIGIENDIWLTEKETGYLTQMS